MMRTSGESSRMRFGMVCTRGRACRFRQTTRGIGGYGGTVLTGGTEPRRATARD
jgi:hypothetical protein